MEMPLMNLRFSGHGLILAFYLASWPARSQSAPAPPQPAPLTLAQVVDIARSKNPSLLSTEQHVDATKAAEITAGLRQNPTFTVSGALTISSGELDPTASGNSVGSFTLENSGTLGGSSVSTTG